jgi:REP element-mobilizing transposase RayT
MPRPLRVQAAGATYHITARGNRRGAIFRDDIDRSTFLGILASTVRCCDWSCLAYCLMTTHYHLLLTISEADIATGMQFINGTYGRRFNRRHQLLGHVFQGRYHSALVKREAHLLELYRYIALNPVRAGACTRPEDWKWSSYAAAIGTRPAPSFLLLDEVLRCFSNTPEQGRILLARFVAETGAA